MMLANLRPVLANYLALGVRSVILARSLRSVAELESLRNVLPIRLRVVELVVSFQEIERRLGSDITAARGDDLEDARAWVTADDGTGFGDLSVTNDRPLREVADEIIQLLGWNA
jgi:hypothetical protein